MTPTKRLMPGLALLWLACGGEARQAGDTKEAPGGAPSTQAAPAGGATITGVVRFTGTAPANPAIDMSEEPVCRQLYPTTPRDPVVAVSNGMLRNVLVSVTGEPATGHTWTPPTTPVVLDQRGCLYTPRVIGVMAGQPIRITNSDAVLHNIKAVPKRNRGFNISQPRKGMETTRTFVSAEDAIPMECNVHGWMHGKVFVMSHPFFAVSDSAGAFTIRGLPGGAYTLTAWHETLGTRTATVTVPINRSAAASFSFSLTP